MCIKHKRLRDFWVPQVTLNGRTIAFVTVQKYLGVLINNYLNDNDDINPGICTIYCSGNILIKKCKIFTVDVKDYLFKTYCTHMYGGHLCFKYNKTISSKAMVAYNCICMKFSNLGRDTSITANMVTSQIPTFYELIR